MQRSPRRLSALLVVVCLVATACGGADSAGDSVASGASSSDAGAETSTSVAADDVGASGASSPDSTAAATTATSEGSTTLTDTGDAVSALVPELVGEFPTLAGGQFDLGSLQGQDTVLWFWAPW